MIRAAGGHQRQRQLDQRQRRHHVDRGRPARARPSGYSASAGWGLGPSVLALLTSRSIALAGGIDQRAAVPVVGRRRRRRRSTSVMAAKLAGDPRRGRRPRARR